MRTEREEVYRLHFTSLSWCPAWSLNNHQSYFSLVESRGFIVLSRREASSFSSSSSYPHSTSLFLTSSRVTSLRLGTLNPHHPTLPKSTAAIRFTLSPSPVKNDIRKLRSQLKKHHISRVGKILFVCENYIRNITPRGGGGVGWGNGYRACGIRIGLYCSTGVR